MNIDNFVMINFWGEAYYSSNAESYTAVVTKDFYNEYKEEIDSYTPYFYELDGKHSEVKGSLVVKNVKGNLKEVVDKILEDDYYPVLENLENICNSTEQEWEEQYAISEDFHKLCKKEVVTTFYFDGEEVK